MKIQGEPVIPVALLRELVRIGGTEAFDELRQSFDPYPELLNGQMMRQRPEFWESIAAGLSDADLADLIKALTVAEHSLPHFRSGSVAPVIFLFRHLRSRQFSGVDELADWIVRHSDNDYLPWGSSRHGARSTKEYEALMQARATRRAWNEEEEKNRTQAARTKKAEKASRDLFHAISHKDVKGIHGLRRKGADVAFIGDDGRSPLDAARELNDQGVLSALTEPLKSDRHE